MGKRGRMSLTAELVSRVPPWVEDESAGPMPSGTRLATDADHNEIVSRLLADRSGDDVWIFAYGSLIWNPGFDSVERVGATAHGWHRSFCLGWDQWFRGSPARPGLMLALDRGGTCKGVAFRLPPDDVGANLGALSRREIHVLPHPFPPRWIRLRGDRGPLRAITFVMDRRSDAYVGGLPPDAVADVLARAAGQRGSMAEYLLNTVERLDEMGLHDGHLWRLQEMVAARLMAARQQV